MQTLYKASRYLLPVAFFGYGAVMNIGFVNFKGVGAVPLDVQALKGSVTSNLDTVYKAALPHREPSVGLIGAARYVLLGEGRKGVLAGEDNWLFTAEEARPMAQDISAPLARITAIRDQLNAVGARLVVVPVPAKMDVYADHAETPAYTKAIADRYAAFRAGLAAAGIASLDSRAALEALQANDPSFFKTDTHWTLHGAAAVAQSLAASGLVPVGQEDFEVVPQKDVQLYGDLVSFVTTDSIAPYLGFAPETVTPYLAQPASADGALQDLFGTGGVDTVLVGTSYSANPDWSFVEALKLALHRDILNFAKQGKGPARPMLEYLASDAFHDTPPAVVIWEFPVRYLSDPTIWDAEKVGSADSAT